MPVELPCYWILINLVFWSLLWHHFSLFFFCFIEHPNPGPGWVVEVSNVQKGKLAEFEARRTLILGIRFSQVPERTGWQGLNFLFNQPTLCPLMSLSLLTSWCNTLSQCSLTFCPCFSQEWGYQTNEHRWDTFQLVCTMPSLCTSENSMTGCNEVSTSRGKPSMILPVSLKRAFM